MADITRVKADVRGLDLIPQFYFRAKAAEEIEAGEAVYLDGSGDALLTDSDAAVSSVFVGIAIAGPDGKTTFAIGDMLDIQWIGRCTGFTGMTPGALIYLSTTVGAIADAASATPGDFNLAIGVSLTATIALIYPQYAAAAVVAGE